MGSEESKAVTPNASEWDPYSFFDPEIDWENGRRPPFALLILNQQITNKENLINLWKHCTCPSQSDSHGGG